MTHHDVFNGDADGLCARQQLRLAAPCDAQLVTGVKRDIGLLARVRAAPGDTVTVLDLSLDRNRAALWRLLDGGVAVEYFDHHYAGTIPNHPLLAAHIDTAPTVCTSVLVDRHLGGRFRRWAAVAAFGDNLDAVGCELARACGLTQQQVDRLRELGQSINYNGYGDAESDLIVAPGRLAVAMQPYTDPLEFIAAHELPGRLREARRRDLGLAVGTRPIEEGPAGSITILPDAAWARRVQGEFANLLTQREPQRAHAVLCELAAGYRVSVRAPLARPRGSDVLCRRFPTGGGRAAAAGIDLLARERLVDFAAAFAAAFGRDGVPPA